MTGQRQFTYYPSDFGVIPVDVCHMDLTFDIYNTRTIVQSQMKLRAHDTPIETLSLNAKNLEITSVSAPGHEISYTCDTEKSLLHIQFRQPVMPNEEFAIHTETICHPTSNILEGLYYDVTPKGAPPQQITQCQQWGFQRLVPCIDDMTAKCTYTTTIIADNRYTNLISNGDITISRHPVADGRDSITYDNSVTPMAPYLFFLGVGTYETFTRPFEYPDGTAFTLELLGPPGTDAALAENALEILADSIQWIYLFTGREWYRTPVTRQEMYRLSGERDRLIQSGAPEDEIWAIRSLLLEMNGTITPGYKYTGTVYREIGMQNSDFGGMENVGNTTITTNRLLAFPDATDGAFEYLMRVKVHEFYHNLNGSEVTGISPFEIWLNEAVTVHIENAYHAFHFGEDYTRLETVLTLLSPAGGTLFFDSGASALPIEPEGFNDPNELITGVTYVKSPEFVRMIETLTGKEAFAEGLARYHARYQHKNASRNDWIHAIEEASGQNFTDFADTWLTQTGYPVITATHAYDAAKQELTLSFSQQQRPDKKQWEMPVTYAVFSHSGEKTASGCFRMNTPDHTIVIAEQDEPAFVSLNRGAAFYGRLVYDPGTEALSLQAKYDDDITSRFLAFTRLCETEIIRLMEDTGAPVESALTHLIADLFSDEKLLSEAGGLFLTIFDAVGDERYAHRYADLYQARRRLIQATAEEHFTIISDVYTAYATDVPCPDGIAGDVARLKRRQVKNTALLFLAAMDTPDVHDILIRQYWEGTTATDRVIAFGHIVNSSCPERSDIIRDCYEKSRNNPVAWETYLSSLAGIASVKDIGFIRDAAQSDSFSLEMANDQRALFGRFAQNKKISLETEEGRSLLEEVLLTLAPVNEYSTGNMLSVFGNLDLMKEEHQAPLIEILLHVLDRADPQKTPSVYNTARRIRAASPVATAVWERENGKIFPNTYT
ncbi:M1 family metallopeptidase [Methanogenium marinum]|uniref:M1 family metallopeptidase n=1 Tax=Methanogenium marinum TaxID=348610 RepID=A0A9Q4KRF0_9EURY|nr:M1 family metallopeptidase [Methanogenium marinum]MDE4907204.1 M1 family metallopeptidase [Methanogenium marinum]